MNKATLTLTSVAGLLALTGCVASIPMHGATPPSSSANEQKPLALETAIAQIDRAERLDSLSHAYSHCLQTAALDAQVKSVESAYEQAALNSGQQMIERVALTHAPIGQVPYAREVFSLINAAQAQDRSARQMQRAAAYRTQCEFAYRKRLDELGR